jgi:hypothetical protein
LDEDTVEPSHDEAAAGAKTGLQQRIDEALARVRVGPVGFGERLQRDCARQIGLLRAKCGNDAVERRRRYFIGRVRLREGSESAVGHL